MNLPKRQREYFLLYVCGSEQINLKIIIQTGRNKNPNVTIARTKQNKSFNKCLKIINKFMNYY